MRSPNHLARALRAGKTIAPKMLHLTLISVISVAILLGDAWNQFAPPTFANAAGKAFQSAATSEQTPRSVSGVPGVATQQEVVNFSELAEQESLSPSGSLEPKEVHRPRPGPRHRPVPPEALRRSEESTLQASESEAEAAETSPAPAASFLALEDDGTRIPPDTNGAVGPNHLMVATNSQVRIQNRNGSALPNETVPLNDFWARLNKPDAFEPKVLYDPFANRWISVAVADDRSATSAVLIGMTQTNDPTRNWKLYPVDADARDQVWVDFPSIGFNKDWIVVTVNVYSNQNDDFLGSHIYVFDKAGLYADGQGRFTLFPFTDGATMVPAITYDNTLSTIFLVEEWEGNGEGRGFLRLSTITGTVGTEKLTTGVAFPATPNPWDSESPGDNFAPQLSSAQKIDTGDARLGNVVYRNGSLWTAHTVFLNAGGRPTRSAVQWWQLSTSGDVLQRGRIDDPTGNVFYAYPSIAVNKNNDVLIGYSQFSATQYASAGYSFRTPTDPANTLRASTVLKAGVAPYFKTSGGTRNRWGAYSNTVVDPANDTDLWTIQEYAAVPSGGTDRWGTWWGKVAPGGAGASCAYSISPASQSYGSAGGTGSVSVTSNPSSCAWTATSNARWISITSDSLSAGNGTVSYKVEANDNPGFRTGTLSIAGWSFTITQAPGQTAELKVDDGSAETVLLTDGLMLVNRLTPLSYPATLRLIRVMFLPYQNQLSPVDKPITLVYFTDPGSSDRPPGGAQMTRISTKVPGTSNSDFFDFPIANGPTITSGDFYVGYQVAAPHSGVGFTIDSNSQAHNRTFGSFDDGATFQGPISLQGSNAANALIRAVVSSELVCTYSITPTSQSFPASGGNGSVNVRAPSGCNWTATSNGDWITINSSASGSGDGAVNFSVAENLSTSPRSGTLMIADQTFTVTQAGANPVASVSAASYGATLAPEAIAAAFGSGLATAIAIADRLPLPTELAGTSVKVRDSAGVERLAPLFFVSPGQINYQVPPETATGAATVTVTSGDGRVSTGTAQIGAVAPGLFAANASGQGVAAGLALRVRNGVQSLELIAQWDASQGRMVPVQLDLGPATDEVFLILFGTGFRYASSLAAVTARIGGSDAQVLYAGPAPGFIGLDQLNLRVPRSLAGCQVRDIVLTVDGHSANVVQVSTKNGACAKV
jgi:uncharacterized protein (TIGR03437 family)